MPPPPPLVTHSFAKLPTVQSPQVAPARPHSIGVWLPGWMQDKPFVLQQPLSAPHAVESQIQVALVPDPERGSPGPQAAPVEPPSQAPPLHRFPVAVGHAVPPPPPH